MLKYLFSFHSQFTSFSSQNGMTLQGKIWSTEIIQCSSGTGSVISSRRIFIILQNTRGRCFETKWFVLLYLPQEGHDKIFRTLNLPHQHFSSQLSTMESKEASRAGSGSIACLASDPFPGLPLLYPHCRGWSCHIAVPRLLCHLLPAILGQQEELERLKGGRGRSNQGIFPLSASAASPDNSSHG